MTEPEPDWVPIPTGVVQRGTPVADIAAVVERHLDLGLPAGYFAKEAPRAAVDVPGFLVARVPVTVLAWNRFAADAGLEPIEAPADHPVDGVAWWQAAAYAEWLGAELGAPVALPSEVQWERAARGDDAREYPWGDDYRSDAANLIELGVGGALPVGSLLAGASPFGVLDLAGNVDEWVRDEYAPYPGAPPEVPRTEPWALDPHLTRGGSPFHARDLARCARRHGLYEGRGAGFRLVSEPA
jgi:formylglycine-generating enzyme required for sulfatase activity